MRGTLGAVAPTGTSVRLGVAETRGAAEVADFSAWHTVAEEGVTVAEDRTASWWGPDCLSGRREDVAVTVELSRIPSVAAMVTAEAVRSPRL